MEVRLAVLCDAANVSQEGKLNILGAFDVIWAKALPTQWPKMAYVVRLACGATDVGNDGTIQIKFGIECRSPDGHVVATVDGVVGVEAPNHGNLLKIPLIIDIQGAMFQEWGTYEFVLSIPGLEPSMTELEIRQIPTA